jgi:hypothetical protein
MKNFEKKSILKFELRCNKLAIPPKGNEKIDICHENLR